MATFILEILRILDSYLRLVLTSWPAVVFIICGLLFFRHKEAIDDFIRRLKSIGPSGAETHSTVEGQKESEESIETLKNQIATLQLNLRTEAQKRLFERIYSNIFGSQILILSRTRTTPGGLPVMEAISIYLDTVNKNPTIRDYLFVNYINYIVNAGLIVLPADWNVGRMQLTNQGNQFLDYLVSESLNLNKPL